MENKIQIGIIGAGAMGTGIAQVAAQNGHQVWVYDTRESALENCRTSLGKTFEKLIAKGKFSEGEANDILGRINWAVNLKELKDCGLFIEAIIENIDAKRSVFELLDKISKPEAILASNTSSLSIAAISAAVKNPGRVVGIHFFNPVPLMPLVEIIPSLATEPSIVEKSRELVDSWKKVTVLAKDTPGFIVNRVARPFYSESLKMLEEGVADEATIDWAMREAGFRMGPFELMDLIGHDVNYVVTETVWTQFYFDPRFRPSLTQKRLLEAGMLGRKSSRGFYNYAEGAQKPEPNRDEKLAKYIVDRTLALLVNEAVDAAFLQVATPKDIDLAMTKGVNYPKGLLDWGKEIGFDKILNRLEDLHQEFGDDRYRPCPLLKKLVNGEKTI